MAYNFSYRVQCLTLIILFSISINSYGQKIEKLLIKAEEAYDFHKDNTAIELCTRVLEKDSLNQKALYIRAKSFRRNAFLDSAYSDLNKVTENVIEKPDLFRSWYTLANSYKASCSKGLLGVDKYDLKAISESLDKYFNLKIEANVKAVVCFENAIKNLENSSWHPIYYDTGLACIDSEQYDKGIAYITQCINRFPEKKAFYYLRGKCYYHNESPFLALLDYQESLKAIDKAFDGYSHTGIGRILFDQNKYKEAIEKFETAIRCKNKYNPEIYYYQGLSKWNIGDESACFDLKIAAGTPIRQYIEDYQKYCPEN